MSKKTATPSQKALAETVANEVAQAIGEAIQDVVENNSQALGAENIRQTWVNMQANISAERIRTALLDVLTEFND